MLFKAAKIGVTFGFYKNNNVLTWNYRTTDIVVRRLKVGTMPYHQNSHFLPMAESGEDIIARFNLLVTSTFR